MDRVAAKEQAMKQGYCGAEYVDQLCETCIRAGRDCPHVPARRDSAGSKKLGKWVKVKAMFSPVTVYWDILPISRVATRTQEGSFGCKSYIRAWIWAKCWLFFHPRGAVSFKSVIE